MYCMPYTGSVLFNFVFNRPQMVQSKPIINRKEKLYIYKKLEKAKMWVSFVLRFPDLYRKIQLFNARPVIDPVKVSKSN